MNDKLIDRVRKLLALSDKTRNTSESEALAALEKAQSLMEEHNLSMSEIELNEKLHEIVEKREQFTSNRPSSWVGMIYGAIYNNIFSCTYYQQKDLNRNTFKYVFVGTPSNLELANHFCRYIIRAIEDISDLEMYKYKKSGGTENGKTWRSSFCYGAAIRVIERLREKYNKSVANVQQQGLVRVQKQAVNEYLEKMGIRIKTKQAGTLKSADGYLSGRDAGNNLGLHDSIGGSRSPSRRMLNG